MKIREIQKTAGALALALTLASTAFAQDFDRSNLSERESELTYSRAYEAVMWAVPIIQSMQIKKELFEKSGKKNSLGYISGEATGKMVLPTFNNVSAPVFGNLDLKDGPMVIEFPAASAEGKFFGTIMDVWDAPIEDFGPAGIDKGKGGKFLLTPPGYKGDVPTGYTQVPCYSYNVHFWLRSIPASKGRKGYENAVKYVHKLKVYPLSQASNPVTNWLDLSSVDGYFWGVPLPEKHDLFALINSYVQEEVVLKENLVMRGILHMLGMEKGKAFSPDHHMREIMNRAAADAYADMEDYLASGKAFVPFWDDARWGAFRVTREILKTRATWNFDTYTDYYARSRDYSYFAVGIPRHFNPAGGGATFYVNTSADKDGKPILGTDNYKLTVPANVPVKDFWAAIMYSTKYRTYTDSKKFGLSSQDDLQMNADGTVDIYVGPKPPAGKESNWLGTVEGDGIFIIFRFYGPKKAIVEKTWKLPDFEKIK